MLKKLLTIFGLVLLSSQVAYAQSGTLRGQVTDAETGETIPSANLYITELSRGAATDIDGYYEISNIPAGTYNLRVSFVGYQTMNQQVNILAGQETVLDIALEAGAIGLDELIVSGYSITTKRELTGSISKVSSSEFEDVPLQNTEGILQGRAAGVTVTTTSGNPGGAFRVNIRGNGSINAATEPLYIVDGVQISFSQQSTLTSQSPLNSLNPNDIESIEVLKDAAAAAIYGSQAAAGVVVITTKKGREGATLITASAQRGVRNATMDVDYLTTDQYLDYMGEARYNNGLSATPEDGRTVYENFFKGFFDTPDGTGTGELADTDWQDFVYDTGYSSKYNVAASGGDAKTRFYLSGGLEDTEGHAFNSAFQRMNLRTNIDHQVNDRLMASVNLNLARAEQFGVCQDGNFINCPTSQAMFEPPMAFPFYDNGEYSPLTRFGLSNNPAVVRDEVERNVGVVSISGNATLNYRINDWLNFRGLFGLDYRTTEDERYETPIARPANGGTLSYNYRNVYNFNTNAVLNAQKTFDGVHNVSGLFGIEYRRDYSTRVGASGEGFPGSFFRVLNASSTPTSASGTNAEFRIGSYFTNLKYNYNEKYFLSFVGRYDGHSRFGAETRWGFFPSISGAWSISEEDFFTFDAVEDLKIRVGYGTTGNANIGNFAARGLYSAVGSYNGETALTPTQLANDLLSWEEAQEINVGVDFSLYKGRISGSVDVYQKDNKNLLLDRDLPLDSGFDDITENVGSIRNEGLEISLSTVNYSNRDFVWSTRVNSAFVRNEVLELAEGQDAINPTSTFSSIQVGQALGIIQVPRWAGVNPADGRPMWYDADGNITYQPNATQDSEIYKDGLANVVGGFGNTLSYKGLSLDVFFQFSFGQWAFANTDYYFNRTPDFLMNLSDITLDRWREEGDVTYFPRAVTAGTNFNETANYRVTLSTASIYNASYIRLKNITLSYNLPTELTERLNLRGVRLFATGINLMTWTAWPYYDPEVADGTNDIFGNLVAASYPTAMQMNGGIEIQF